MASLTLDSSPGNTLNKALWPGHFGNLIAYFKCPCEFLNNSSKKQWRKNSLCRTKRWAQLNAAPQSEPRENLAGTEFALIKALQTGVIFLCYIRISYNICYKKSSHLCIEYSNKKIKYLIGSNLLPTLHIQILFKDVSVQAPQTKPQHVPVSPMPVPILCIERPKTECMRMLFCLQPHRAVGALCL